MRSRRPALTLAALVLPLPFTVAAQHGGAQATGSQPPAVAQTVGVTASRVAVDLVVRDRKGRLVRDLEPSEVELLEDGSAQEILSLRLVDTLGGARGRAEGHATAGPAPTPQAPRTEEHPLFVAFLFDRLSPQARQTAHQAAVDWLKRPAPPGRRVGVYRIDQTLETMQPFTDDADAMRQALDLVLRAAPSQFNSKADRDRLRALRQSLLAIGPPTPGEGPRGGSPAAVPGPTGAESAGLEVARSQDALRGAASDDRAVAGSEYARLQLEMAMLEAEEALERDQQGLATVNAILALVNGLKTAPGRKAIVFFSEGLVLTTRAATALRSVVSEANRGGVTFYTADAAGLRTVSSASETRRDLASIAQVMEQSDRAKPGELMKAIERNEDILRSDPHSGLGALARETGGFLVSDTNEIGGALAAAEEDLASYYLLEYAPANELWDGRFRRIEARVKRPSVHVQARQGYFAVKTSMPTPLLDFEAPVLAALEMAPRASELVFRTSVAQLPDQADECAVPVLVDVPGDAPTLDLVQKEKRYQQDFTVLVLVRDQGGRVVRKLSRRFLNSGPIEKADETRQGRMLVLRETWLPAGTYTVEAAVQDAPSGRLGVQRIPLEIAPGAEDSLRVSSLVVVGHATPHAEGPADAPALLLDGRQLYPSAAGPVSASGGRPLPFFLVVHPARGRQAPNATVELRQGDNSVFTAPAPLKPAIGRTTLLGGVPLEGVAPGGYELRVTVADGVDRVVRWAKVTIAP
jgi:VWFA-related protein